jgi:hypothetical protein
MHVMRTQIGFLGIIAFFGTLAAADAQMPPSPPTGTTFDGKYRLVSSARVNQMFTTQRGLTAQCPDRRPGPLTIRQGQARYTSETGYRLRGTVGPQGELAMQGGGPGGSRPIVLTTRGTIDGNGTARARQTSNACNYDFVWQR